MSERFLNLAFYHFVDLADAEATRLRVRALCENRDFRGTILISREGINGVLSGPEASLRTVMSELRMIPEFAALEFKESWSSGIAFPRMLVKLKKELIPLGRDSIRPHERTGKRIAPKELKQWYDENRDFVIVDTRNGYEVDYGTFKNAVTFDDLRHFRTFPEKLETLGPEPKKKTVVMFCTGGIRCEKATVAALDAGFDDVYQLDGGILKYFEECGGAHYDGNCFVFDRRIAVKPDLSELLPPG